jgi:hypothetical protein
MQQIGVLPAREPTTPRMTWVEAIVPDMTADGSLRSPAGTCAHAAPMSQLRKIVPNSQREREARDGVGKFAVRFDTMRPWPHVLAAGRVMPMCSRRPNGRSSMP